MYCTHICVQNLDKYQPTKNRNITHQYKYSCLIIIILVIKVLKPPDNETIHCNGPAGDAIIIFLPYRYGFMDMLKSYSEKDNNEKFHP